MFYVMRSNASNSAAVSVDGSWVHTHRSTVMPICMSVSLHHQEVSALGLCSRTPATQCTMISTCCMSETGTCTWAGAQDKRLW